MDNLTLLLDKGLDESDTSDQVVTPDSPLWSFFVPFPPLPGLHIAAILLKVYINPL